MVKRLSIFISVALFSFLNGPFFNSLYAQNECALKGQILVIKPIQKLSAKKPGSIPAYLPELVSLLMKDYFNISSKIGATFQDSPAFHDRAFIVQSGIKPQNAQFLFQSQIESPASSKEPGKILFRYEAPFEFPQNLNLLLTDYILKASQALGVKVKEKDILPFLNQTPSSMAYLSYAEGISDYQAHNLLKAQKAFETAIKNDYNYVPAYVGLSQVLEELINPQSKVEWQKAQLLNPHLSKMIRERGLCP